MFKFYLDNQLADQPDNDRLLSTSLKRDSQLKGLLMTQDVELVWTNNNNLSLVEISGYQYIKSIFDDSICNEIDVHIYDQLSATETLLIYTGVIKIPQLEFNEQPVSVKIKIQDNSFYAYINNNKDLNVNLSTTQTKNKIDITALDFYAVDMFSSFTGVYGSTVGAYYKGYRVSDVFGFIIKIITDNKVAFRSDYLDSLTYDLMLFKGQSLLNSYTLFPVAEEPVFEISFSTLFTEIDKAKNLYYYVDYTDFNNPVFRIEYKEDTYTDSTIFTFSDIKELKTTIDISKLYTTVQVGSDKTASGRTINIYTFNEATSYYGWKKEQYHPLGQCNISSELNLVNSFVISNNAILEVLIGLSTDTIDDFFLVECDTVNATLLTAKAHRYDFFGQTTPPFYYNFGLNNVNKISLHSGDFQTALTNSQASSSNICHISLGQTTEIANFNTATNGGTGSPYTIMPIPFADEFGGVNYDGGNNWNPAIYYYTAPVSGNYSFEASLNMQVQNTKQCTNGQIQGPGIPSAQTTTISWGVEIKLGIIAYTDNTFTTILGTAVETFVTQVDGIFNIAISQPLLLTPGSTVRVFTTATSILTAPLLFGNTPLGNTYTISNCGYGSGNNRIVTAFADSYFECNGTPDGNVSIISGNTKIKKLFHFFDYDISQSDWQTIVANPIGNINFEKDGVTRRGWIEEMVHNNWTGRTKIKLISQDATI